MIAKLRYIIFILQKYAASQSLANRFLFKLKNLLIIIRKFMVLYIVINLNKDTFVVTK